MPRILVTMREGQTREVDGDVGATLMEVIRDNDLALDAFAICGGSCACATCHVYVDADFAAKLPALGEDENDLLDGTSARKPESRLSCQLPITEALDGLRVTVAPAD